MSKFPARCIVPGMKEVTNSDHLKTNISITPTGMENIPQDKRGLNIAINRVVILIVIKIVIETAWRVVND
jgi:hypothetical protein